MLRFGIGAFVLAFVLVTLLRAQGKQKSKPVAETASGVTTVTSVDKDHTVVGWVDLVPFTSKIFHNAQRKYPVLYMQDGQNLFDDATAHAGEWHVDETVDHLVGSFKIPPMIVVGIDNAGDKRAYEYLPYPDPHKDTYGQPDQPETHSKEYAKFVISEVMPFIEKKYHVATGAANTGIGGSSYGGVASLYTVLQYPGVFGHALIESPVLGVGNGQLMKDAEQAKQLPQKMFLAMGTNETKDEAYNAQLVKNTEELEGILRKKGLGPSRLRVVVEEGAVHNEEAWSRRLPEALAFLYGN